MKQKKIDWSKIHTTADEANAIVNVGNDRINRLNDRFVKSLLTNPQNESILIDFVNKALLLREGQEIVEITLAPGELVQRFDGLKLSRLDISAVFKDGRTCDIEFQIADKQNFRKRSPFYWAMRHVLKLASGSAYDEIQPTIFICLLAFTLFPEEQDYRNAYSIRNDKSGNQLADDLQIVYIELSKFLREREDATSKSDLERWLMYFSNRGGDEMNKIAEHNPAIEQAMNFEQAFWASQEEREYYFSAQMALLDEISAVRRREIQEEKFRKAEEKFRETEEKFRETEEKSRKTEEKLQAAMKETEKAAKEAEEKGIEKGVEQEKIEIAKKLLSLGAEPDFVATASGLSSEAVEALREN